MRIRYINNTTVFYDIWKWIATQDLRNGDIAKYVLDDLAKANISVDKVKDFTWIVDAHVEGHDADDVEHLRQYLIGHGVTRFGAVYTCYVDTDKLPYPAVCLPNKMIYNDWYQHLQLQQVDWQNMPMTHKLVCPMRRPSLSRVHLAKRLLGIFDPSEIIISLGTNNDYVREDIKQLIQPHPWPLMVDHPIVDNKQQHRLKHEKFYTAPVKLVVESSNEIDPGVWTSQFITEKSYKALCWRQLPVWYAVPGLVERIREQGFDVFDDVIDHSYDLEVDPWKRMVMVLIEIKRLTLLNTVQIRNDVWSRLESNADLINGIHNTAHSQHEAAITGLINELIHEST